MAANEIKGTITKHINSASIAGLIKRRLPIGFISYALLTLFSTVLPYGDYPGKTTEVSGDDSIKYQKE